MADNNHIHYTAEDIHRYFSGSMTASEMHAMEKAALNDPLLSEAMEGYQQLPSFAGEAGYASVKKDLDELKHKLTERNIRIKKPANNWWKAAAAVLILFGSVFAWYLTSKSNHQKENSIAKQDVHVPSSITTADSSKVSTIMTDSISRSNADLATTNTESGAITPKTVKDKKEKQLTFSNSNAASGNYYIMMDSSADLAAKDNIKEKITPPVSQQINNNVSTQRITGYKNDADKNFNTNGSDGYMSFKKTDALTKKQLLADRKSSLAFSGKITDANNNAIPFAHLFINNTQQAKTDINGAFNINLPDSVIRLDVAAKNYFPKRVTITPNNFINIILASSKNTLKKSTIAADTLQRSQVQLLYKLGVEPKEGWDKYILYLVDQLSNSTYDDGKRVVGEMIVKFEVNRDYQPVNFTFEKSIDDDVNDAVENLILTGPEWKAASEISGLPGIVKLRITF